MRRPSPARRRFRIPAALVGLLVSSVAFGVTVVVTSTADVVTICASTGHPSASGGEGCTLRDAILFSNANPQPQAFANLIQFNIPGSGVHTIGLGLLGSGVPLPAITTGTTIDGYSQPGASPNLLAVGDNAVLLIQVLGDEAAEPLLHLTGGAGTLIQGLVLNGLLNAGQSRYPHSISLDSSFNVVAGNFIAIAPDGNSFNPGIQGGIFVNSGDNVIGGSTPADRNLLGVAKDLNSIHGLVELRGATGGNRVEGNYFGLNASGFLLPGNDGGTYACILVDTNDNFIGGSPAERNVVAGCVRGIDIDGDHFEGDGNAVANVVEGNYIGTDATGNGAAPNFVGVSLWQAGGNFLGALTAGNRIAFNQTTGVLLQGSSQGNTICCNSIFSNGGLGIDLSLKFASLGGDGVNGNDPGDTDGGPNGLQNFPVLTQASSDNFTTNIIGLLNSLPNTSFRIQFFSNTACDLSGYGEGEDFLGESFVATDGNGDVSFNASPLVGGLAGQFITSTATNLSTGDTSEFSACQQVEGVGGGKKVKGTIQSIDPPTHSFVLEPAAGGVTVWTDAETTFRKNHQLVEFSSLAAGDRAKVKGFQLGDGSILALKVTIPQEDPDE